MALEKRLRERKLDELRKKNETFVARMGSMLSSALHYVFGFKDSH